MKAVSLSIPKGTRDFSPAVMSKRNYLFGVIRKHFERFGFAPLETPSMENYATLTGKYGEEGDQLLFKILNNGDYLKDVSGELLNQKASGSLVPQLCDRALRYDLTVPFARYVAMHAGQMTFPFKRYQIQPVWRADRPQKGRYREFYQCDADIIGTTSMWCEVELMHLFDAVLSELGLDVTISVNHRMVLQGLAEVAGVGEQFVDMTVALDKLDKIGWDGVTQEMISKGMSEKAVQVIRETVERSGTDPNWWEKWEGGASATKGMEDMKFLIEALEKMPMKTAKWKWDLTLARGLNYYTGCIVEVKVNGANMGSICGGGRYDNLTGIFGVPHISGVGISFGADRIYDVMEEMMLFPQEVTSSAQVLIAQFDEEGMLASQQWGLRMREAGLRVEVYPEPAKMKKQFKYADDRRIPYVIIMGPDERAKGVASLKNMHTGEQIQDTLTTLIEQLHGNK